MKRSTKRKPNELRLWLLSFVLVVTVALGVGISVLLKSEKRQICVVDQGDVVCMDENLSNLERHEFLTVGPEAKAISSAPGNKYFIVDPDTEFRDDPLDLYDQNKDNQGALNLPVSRYDIQKIQWTSDGSKAYVLSDIGVLYEFDVASKQTKQITNDRADMNEGEDFSQNKRGFIVDYYLINDNRLVITAQNYDTFEFPDEAEIYGPQNDTRLFVMDVDGSGIQRLGASNRVVWAKPATDSKILFSVNPSTSCEWGDECRQLYMIDIDTGVEELIAGKDLEFRDFTYDEHTKTVYLARGPGGSVWEVYYGPLKDFAQRVNKVKFAQPSGTTWGPLSLIPLGRDSLAVVSSDGVKFGVIEKFNLKEATREASIDAPQLNFDGVDQLVRHWK